MIQYVLYCILWAKPNVEIIQVPVNEYAMADINHDFGEFNFEASVFEEKMNSVKITHRPTQISSQANASADYQQRSFYLKLDLGEKQASLDCEMKAAGQQGDQP